MALYSEPLVDRTEARLAHHSTDQRNAFFILSTILCSLSTVAVICRVYVRCIRKHSAGLDDICIVIALCARIFGQFAGSKFTYYGLGKHTWELSPPEVAGAIKWLIIGVFGSYIGLFFIRLSIGVFILRVLAEVQLKLRLAVYTAIALNFFNSVIVITVLLVWCRPMEGIWNKTIPAKCLSGDAVNNAYRAFAGTSAAIDVVHACLPVAVIWPLQMDKKTKRNLCVIALLTIVICVCAIGKAIDVNETSEDVTYVNLPVCYWAVVEADLGTIVASLPALRQFCIVTREDFTVLKSKTFGSGKFRGTHQPPLDARPQRLVPTAGGQCAWQTLNDDDGRHIEARSYVANAE